MNLEIEYCKTVCRAKNDIERLSNHFKNYKTLKHQIPSAEVFLNNVEKNTSILDPQLSHESNNTLENAI